MKTDFDNIAIGRVIQAHGVQGWVKVTPYSGLPERFEVLKTLYLDSAGGLIGYILDDIQYHNMVPLLKFRGIDSRDSARKLVGQEILVSAAQQVELPEDTYFIHQLLGLQVFDNHSEFIGTLEEVLTAAGNDVYVVRNEGTEVLIPAVSQFIRQVDLDAGRIDVQLIEGMRDAN